MQRLEGHGIETTTPGGVIIPATVQKGVRNKPDTFRARVLAMGPEATRQLSGELAIGADVLLYTYDGEADSVFTGEQAEGHGLFVRPADILCVLEGP